MSEPDSSVWEVATALRGIHQAIDFVGNIQGAPRAIHSLQAELDELIRLLQRINAFVNLGTSAQDAVMPQLREHLIKCQDVAFEVETNLRPCVKPTTDPRRTTWSRLSGVFKEHKIAALQKQTNQCKCGIDLTFTSATRPISNLYPSFFGEPQRVVHSSNPPGASFHPKIRVHHRTREFEDGPSWDGAVNIEDDMPQSMRRKHVAASATRHTPAEHRGFSIPWTKHPQTTQTVPNPETDSEGQLIGKSMVSRDALEEMGIRYEEQGLFVYLPNALDDRQFEFLRNMSEAACSDSRLWWPGSDLPIDPPE